MGREIRRVPLNWQHPIEWVQRIDRFAGDGSTRPELSFKPLFERDYYETAVREYDPTDPDDAKYGPPKIENYMPDFSDVPEDEMGICMYETTSEGTPISPVFKDPDELAHWLADNNASTFGSSTGTYEQWKAMIDRSGWAPSAMFSNETGLISGVEAVARDAQ